MLIARKPISYKKVCDYVQAINANICCAKLFERGSDQYWYTYPPISLHNKMTCTFGTITSI